MFDDAGHTRKEDIRVRYDASAVFTSIRSVRIAIVSILKTPGADSFSQAAVLYFRQIPVALPCKPLSRNKGAQYVSVVSKASIIPILLIMMAASVSKVGTMRNRVHHVAWFATNPEDGGKPNPTHIDKFHSYQHLLTFHHSIENADVSTGKSFSHTNLPDA